MNTIWNEWYYQDRFLGKPYPFIDNISRPEIKENEKEVENGDKPTKRN